MPKESIGEYLKARRAFVELTNHLEETLNGLWLFCNKLRLDWRNAHFIDSPTQRLSPDHLNIRPKDWPSFEDVRGAVDKWRDERRELNRLWDSMPGQDQEGIQPPPA